MQVDWPFMRQTQTVAESVWQQENLYGENGKLFTLKDVQENHQERPRRYST